MPEKRLKGFSDLYDADAARARGASQSAEKSADPQVSQQADQLISQSVSQLTDPLPRPARGSARPAALVVPALSTSRRGPVSFKADLEKVHRLKVHAVQHRLQLADLLDEAIGDLLRKLKLE